MKRKRAKQQKRERYDLIQYTKRFKSRFNNLYLKLGTLDSMVGMADVKSSVKSQVKFLLCNNGKTDGHFLHTVIAGPSGCGKTTLAKVLFELWSEMDIFENGKFTVLHRSDLVGGYMGQTAAKTQKVLMKHKGGCIFIDEFYSLVYGDDSYGRECVDVLNTFMSENSDTVVIVAGYKDEMARVFSAQPGLKRRFAWTLDIPKYTAIELLSIFRQQLKEYGWDIADHIEVLQLFEKNYTKFEFQGGDTLNLCLKSKLEYARRNWRGGGDKKITTEDVTSAMSQHFNKKKQENCMYL